MQVDAVPLTTPSPVASAQVDRHRIIRAIASSTAIETGESTHEIELRLHADNSKYQLLDLAVLAVAG